MRLIFVFLAFSFLPVDSYAQTTWRKFRWSEGNGTFPVFFRIMKIDNPLTSLTELRLGKEISGPKTLTAAGELVVREIQSLDGAKVTGAWSQTVMSSNGKVIYTTGELLNQLPNGVLGLESMRLGKESALRMAKATVPALKEAAKIFTPTLEIRQTNKEWQAYWRVEYLSKKEDHLYYLFLTREGTILEKGEVPWDGIDGRALVFPKGPRFSELKEETLSDLVGDGNLTGALLRVRSALNLNVWSPEFKFIFPQEDRRFDMAQAYFTINNGFRWMKEKLGVETQQPIEVRVHIGENGVSNAAFYHQNTIYLGTGDGVIYRDLLRDPSVLLHEAMHSLIDAYVGLPSDGEGGGFNEGFADLLTALILDNPRIGEVSYLKAPYRRTLENNLQAYRDFNSGVYQNGSIIAATFWDMKHLLGNEKTAQLAFRTLIRLGKGARFDDFVNAFTSAATSLLNEDQRSAVIQIVKNRGWKL